MVALRGVSSQAAAPGKLRSGLGLYSLGKHFCVLGLYSVSLVLDEIMEGELDLNILFHILIK